MTVRVLHGDCRDVLRTLPDASVQCCVTSPPYWNLRRYLPEGHPDAAREIGGESSPDEYVAQMVAVFREVRRALHPTGVAWVNIGDSYRDKQRLLIPARCALAFQADGWWLRDEVIWHKPRTTPFPANDRTVPAHEMVYLLARSERYFFDWAAIEEPADYAGDVRNAGKAFRDLDADNPRSGRKRSSAGRVITVRDTRRKRSVWSVSPPPYGDGHFATMPPEIAETCIKAGTRPGDTVLDPFFGAGTTALAADRLQRHCIGIELNPDYIDIGERRITGDAPLFAEVAA